jgi:AraC-like DNA-binding protein
LVIYDRRISRLGDERSAARLHQNQFDHFTLQLNLGGELHGAGEDGFRQTAPGEILFIDMAKPMRSRMFDLHVMTVDVPRSLIEAVSTSADNLHGLVMPPKIAKPLADFLEVLFAASREDQLGAEGPLLHHLASSFGKMGLSNAHSALDDVRLVKARTFIRAHLTDEDLSPGRITDALGWSRSTLYRVFEPLGGVRCYVRTQRLVRLKNILTDPGNQQRIARLAHETGFVSEHHANRSFRRYFGVPPAEFRRRMRGLTPSAYGDRAASLKQLMIASYAGMDQSGCELDLEICQERGICA